jgi:hypothetical protein
MKKALVLIAALIIICSCSDEKGVDEQMVDGDWDDNIKLSTKDVDLASHTDSVIITTEGDYWLIGYVCFEDSIYDYYHQESINLEAESYVITENDFLIERQDKNTLFVKINENTSGNKRVLNITISSGDYFDNVFINQAAN